jgi:hypothetical protein
MPLVIGNTALSPSQFHTLVLLDIENLCGGALAVTSNMCRQVRYRLAETVDLSSALVVVASGKQAQRMNPHIKRDVGATYHLVRPGMDGADKALLAFASSHELLGYQRVVIGSGDHAFAGLAKELSSKGIDVSVLACRASVARELRNASSQVHHFAPLRVIQYKRTTGGR